MSDFDLPIAKIGAVRHRRAVFELVNRERRRHGLRPLRFARSLSLSARAWARALSRDSTFTHGKFAKRVLRFPFVLASAGRPWKAAENLAWGRRDESTPRNIVARWMASPEHRRNILGPWQYGAVWSQRDAPKRGPQPDGAIVVQHFGRRG
jgi:uncharacterized protein YkwD